jgi:hypothetical protein
MAGMPVQRLATGAGPPRSICVRGRHRGPGALQVSVSPLLSSPLLSFAKRRVYGAFACRDKANNSAAKHDGGPRLCT